MAIIGFIACVAVMIYLSIFAWLVLLNSSGPYNIGGACNPPFKRIAAVILAFGVGCLWYELFLNAPFTITVN